jgi:hypothetical protein
MTNKVYFYLLVAPPYPFVTNQHLQQPSSPKTSHKTSHMAPSHMAKSNTSQRGCRCRQWGGSGPSCPMFGDYIIHMKGSAQTVALWVLWQWRMVPHQIWKLWIATQCISGGWGGDRCLFHDKLFVRRFLSMLLLLSYCCCCHIAVVVILWLLYLWIIEKKRYSSSIVSNWLLASIRF